MRNSSNKLKSKYQYIGFLPKSIRIKEDGYWGINDYDGNEILPSSYIEVFTLSSGHGLIAARDDGYWKIFDFDGNLVNSNKYDSIYPYYGLFGMAKVKIGYNWGLINKNGHISVPIRYKKIEKFGQGLILLNHNLEKEFIDRKDLLKLPLISNRSVKIKLRTPLHKSKIKVTSKKREII